MFGISQWGTAEAIRTARTNISINRYGKDRRNWREWSFLDLVRLTIILEWSFFHLKQQIIIKIYIFQFCSSPGLQKKDYFHNSSFLLPLSAKITLHWHKKNMENQQKMNGDKIFHGPEKTLKILNSTNKTKTRDRNMKQEVLKLLWDGNRTNKLTSILCKIWQFSRFPTKCKKENLCLTHLYKISHTYPTEVYNHNSGFIDLWPLKETAILE